MKDKLALHDKFQADQEGYANLYTREEVDRIIREAPSYAIDPDKWQGCMICARRCPVEAIWGGKKQVHVIDQERCVKCGTCLEVCPLPFSAVTKCLSPFPPPVPPGAIAAGENGKETLVAAS